MIRTAIVEDDPAYMEQIASFLQRYEKENGEAFQIRRFSDGDEIVEGYKAEYDLILMDVQMRFMDGMAAAEEIRKTDKEVVIIFITNMRQYAIRGYAVDAMDYIIKPISYISFSERLKKAIDRMHHREKHYIVINIKGGMLRIAVDDIFYVESQGHTLVYHTKSGNYEVYGTMKDAEENLLPYHFCRGNKGYLIDLAYVEGIQDGEVIVHGEHLALSRGRKNPFLEALAAYWTEVK